MSASEGVKDMRISISGKNLEVSDYMRETAEKKLNKLSKFFPQDA